MRELLEGSLAEEGGRASTGWAGGRVAWAVQQPIAKCKRGASGGDRPARTAPSARGGARAGAAQHRIYRIYGHVQTASIRLLIVPSSRPHGARKRNKHSVYVRVPPPTRPLCSADPHYTGMRCVRQIMKTAAPLGGPNRSDCNTLIPTQSGWLAAGPPALQRAQINKQTTLTLCSKMPVSSRYEPVGFRSSYLPPGPTLPNVPALAGAGAFPAAARTAARRSVRRLRNAAVRQSAPCRAVYCSCRSLGAAVQDCGPARASEWRRYRNGRPLESARMSITWPSCPREQHEYRTMPHPAPPTNTQPRHRRKQHGWRADAVGVDPPRPSH